MGRLLLVCLLAGSGCLDWDSLYSDQDAGSGAADATGDQPDAPPSPIGCSDGTAEALLAETGLAACSGAWGIPGVVSEEPPACDRAAGNDGNATSGERCNVADLCAVGWHVCRDAADVATHGGDAACSQLKPPDPDGGDSFLFLTRQRGSGDLPACAPDGSAEGADDAWGCGTLGLEATECQPLDRHLSLDGDAGGCTTSSFSCGEDPRSEGQNVSKIDARGGGVLCCRDDGTSAPAR